MRVAHGLILLPLTACLGPLVDDTPAVGPDILAPGTPVPAWADDARVRTQIAMNQGVTGTVRLETAFAGGASIHVWDFGNAPTFASPEFVLVGRDSNGALVPVDHHPIVKALPGDASYSPFWTLYYVEITGLYHGEILPSSQALDEAIQAGLALAPVHQPIAMNGPIVNPDIQVEVGGGQKLSANATFYYNGATVPYFDFGPIPLMGNSTIPDNRRYQLHREGGDPLSEIVRNVDMDGDGDTVDSNDIYTSAPNTAANSPLARTVTVAIPAGTASIDTTHDETMAAIADATQLFAPDPTANVVSFTVTTERHNRPGQRTPGGL